MAAIRMTAKRPIFLTLPHSTKVPKTAMVMAAGLGKRMRPLTATKPKPLVTVAGKPLIDHALSRLAAAGVMRAVVNVHYLADAMEAHLSAIITVWRLLYRTSAGFCSRQAAD